MPILRLTLDTNCVIHAAQSRDQSRALAQIVDELVEHARNGHVGLALTTAFDNDQQTARADRAAMNRAWLADRPLIGRPPQPFRLDFSVLDGGDVFGADDTGTASSALEAIILPAGLRPGALDAADEGQMRKFERKILDVQHLLAHQMSGNDAFVTTDINDIIKNRDLIQAETGIEVWTLAEAINVVRAISSA